MDDAYAGQVGIAEKLSIVILLFFLHLLLKQSLVFCSCMKYDNNQFYKERIPFSPPPGGNNFAEQNKSACKRLFIACIQLIFTL